MRKKFEDPTLTWADPKPRALQARLVKAVWEAMADVGACDSYGGSEDRRCKPTVVEFVQKIFDECNGMPR